MKPRITIFTLGVKDLERSLQFYRDGLGFPTKGIVGTEFEHGAVVFFELAHGLKLALYPRNDLALDATVPETSPSSIEFSIGYNVNSQREVDEIMLLAQNAGATVVKPAAKTFWGGYSGYFEDPDGHLWEIAWSPTLKIVE